MSDGGRIDELEIIAAHQARQIEELSDTVTQQWKTIEDLQRKLKRLGERFAEIEQASEAPPDTARPPHW